MSFDAGALAQMSFNAGSGFQSGTPLAAPTSGFGSRGSRFNAKRLSVALPPKVASISENGVENPTPRTSRSHLLAGLRTQPKNSAVPASAPYHQTQHQPQGLQASQWADNSYGTQARGVPQTATTASFDMASQHAMNAGRQMYSLPEQVLAPPSVYDQAEEMDPNVLQQMQLTSMFLAQRQQQLQQQLANLTAAAQGMTLNNNMHQMQYQQNMMPQQAAQNFYAQQQQQQQIQSPIEVPGQPGVYLVYNPAVQGYSYVVDQTYQQQQQFQQQQQQRMVLPAHQVQTGTFAIPQQQQQQQQFDHAAQVFGVSPPAVERSTPTNGRSFTPPKKAPSPPAALEHVEPLPPPSATAFRRGHKKASSLAINPYATAACDGPKTSSNATFGSQRSVYPAPPMTGTFGPGAARAGEHPIRQPRGPPPLEELNAAPTSRHEGSKNFATRQRRRALDSLTRAGNVRRGVSRSSGGSPASERDCYFPPSSAVTGVSADDLMSAGSSSSRKMSPIGSEMQEKRNSHGSSSATSLSTSSVSAAALVHDDAGYFGLISSSSASSSDEEAGSLFKAPPTPATPVGGELPQPRKKLVALGGVLNAAEKRKSLAL